MGWPREGKALKEGMGHCAGGGLGVGKEKMKGGLGSKRSASGESGYLIILSEYVLAHVP